MEKREDQDEKGPRLKPSLYAKDGEVETEDTVLRQRAGAEVQEKIRRRV